MSSDIVPTLLRAAHVSTGQRALDVATGTGIVAAAASDIIGPSGHVTATDLSGPMLDQARRRLETRTNVDFALMNGQALTFPKEHFDVVLCGMALMFFPLLLAPLLVHLFAPFVFPVVFAPAVPGAEHDKDADEDEYAGGNESAEFCLRVEVLYDQGAADQDEDQPGAAAEVMTEPDEQADGDEEDVPAEEPIGEWKTHLV